MIVGLAIAIRVAVGYRSATISFILDRRVPLLAVALWPDRSVRLDAIE